ncbi:MAG TPA: glycosyltransferase [Patescibacteria group bacterium]|nr:glycosyltransferase [Patescibacteria group bacterium]
MKVWLCYARVGAGHEMPARAVVEELRERYGTNVQVELIDIFTFIPPWGRTLLEGGYQLFTHQLPWVYTSLFFFGYSRILTRFENFLFYLGSRRRFRERLAQDPPDTILFFHFFVDPFVRVLRDLRLSTPITVVVTDLFTVHPFWFLHPELSYIVFSSAIADVAQKAGVDARQITIVPPLIQKKFLVSLSQLEQEAARKKYGLTVGEKAVLILGGGNGLPRGVRITKALLMSPVRARYIFVAGHNERLRKKMIWLQREFPQQLVVVGFTGALHELVAISDVVVGKAGASETMEVLSMRKPFLMVHYIWRQELGNMQFVLKHGVGRYEPRIRRIPWQVHELLTNTEEVARLTRNQTALQPQSGAAEVAEYIVGRNGKANDEA